MINHDTLERLRDELANLHPSVVVERQGPDPPPADLRCCANCAHWHKKEYIHCQCSGPWGGNIFGDKNCTFRARKVRSNVKVTGAEPQRGGASR